MNNCYMTLMTNEKFLPCVIRAAYTFKYYNSKYPYIVLIPKHNNYLKYILSKYNIEYKEIEIDKCQIDNINMYYNDTINKFQIFNYTEFDQICFLDADAFFIGNVDKEFEKAKNTNFYGYYEIDRKTKKPRLMGGLFIIKPNETTYPFLLKNMENQYFENDENILDIYFKNTSSINYLIDEYMHFGNYIKPWENFNKAPSFIKSFFTDMPLTDFNYWIDNIQEFLGRFRQWSLPYELGNLNVDSTFLIIPQNKKEILSSINLVQQFKNYGSIYNLIIYIHKSLITNDILNKLDHNEICFIVYETEQIYTSNQIFKILKVFEPDYHKICIIKNTNFKITENLDCLLNNTINKQKKLEILQKYKKDLILYTYDKGE